MTKRYRLTARAQFHGEVRDPGYVFTLEDGERGPHRTVSAANPGAQIADHIGGETGMVDEPLYVEISDEHNAAIEEAEQKKLDEADLAAQETAEHGAKQPEAPEGKLKEDGPTIAEWVAAGYSADAYPPSGYASRSTPEEIAAFKPAAE
jgi:hypothetical protein